MDKWCEGGRSGVSAARSAAAPDLLGGLAKTTDGMKLVHKQIR